MNTFAAALAPIFVLILLGFGLRLIGFLADAAWAGMEKLTYFVLFPALLVRTLGGQSLVGAPWAAMLLIVVGTLMVSALVLVLIHVTSKSEDGPGFTSVFQGASASTPTSPWRSPSACSVPRGWHWDPSPRAS